MFKHLYLLFLTAALFSCTNKKETLDVEPINDYVTLQVGKSITYRLDSTVFTFNGTRIETHKYQVRHTVLKEVTDDGQKSFMIQRLLNNETATGSWVNNGTYLVTLHENKIEVITDNLRVIALQSPLRKGFSWKGNGQLPFAPYKQLFDFSLIGYDMNSWNFSYTDFGDETIEGQSYKSVWTVAQNNEVLNMPPTANTEFATKEVSIEKYAKGIGLVYKDYQMYEYQKGTSAFYMGFGITMWMISHN
ncbi:hypothetical protein U0035_08545 [Niabella yanshanensis]|uniref:Uncharacterized protein n=1 Tax=Niabella yanshanensis TaxID=577386 RepID=A0ABZ0WAH5_9BACT|nr:hypothetical protein [Niabella yanshanensis]WQD40191.1 hypothetical protein U0035_08545 [Niabella yanshanensis]